MSPFRTIFSANYYRQSIRHCCQRFDCSGESSNERTKGDRIHFVDTRETTFVISSLFFLYTKSLLKRCSLQKKRRETHSCLLQEAPFQQGAKQF